MTWIGTLRTRRYAAEISEREAFYARARNPQEIRALQLERLNAEWSRAVADVPYLERLRRERRLLGWALR